MTEHARAYGSHPADDGQSFRVLHGNGPSAPSAQTLPATLARLRAPDVFGEPRRLDAVLAEIESAARSIVADVDTERGRKALASLAAKVARSKTYLDGLGKDLVADWKRRAGEVDAQRRHLRERLDALKAEVRAPLTAYEQREADRQARIAAMIGALGQMPPDDPFTDSETIAERIADLQAVEIGDQDYAERADEARRVRAATLYELGRRLERVRERETAEAKAAAERQEHERRERAEREARIAAEAAEQARREAEQAAAAERQRIIAARDRAARGRIAAEQREIAAREAQARAERDAEQAAQRERQRLAEAQAREQAEAERRAADREHRRVVNRAAVHALLDHTHLSAGDAQEVIAAIADGKVPGVSIAY